MTRKLLNDIRKNMIKQFLLQNRMMDGELYNL